MVLLNSQRSWITLEDELEMLTIYLDMERLRFKNTFDYHIVFTNRVDAGAIFIPPLLLQPFCENAIWHGLKHLADPQSGRQDQGRLDIELSMHDKVLTCVITDNGIGRQKAGEMNSKTAEKEKSMGLKITADRLALLNSEKGRHTSYEITDLRDEKGNAGGTRVTLNISFKESIEQPV
jgi:sensor histidine kinase YesM